MVFVNLLTFIVFVADIFNKKIYKLYSMFT